MQNVGFIYILIAIFSHGVIFFGADSVTTNGSKSNTNSYEGAYLEAKSQLEKEEHELETTIPDIAEVQVTIDLCFGHGFMFQTTEARSNVIFYGLFHYRSLL